MASLYTQDELKFHPPVRILVSSASQTGKTEKLILFLKHREILFSKPFARVVFFTPTSVPLTYSVEMRLKEACSIIEFEQDIAPNMDFTRYNTYHGQHSLFVFDDLSAQIVNSKTMLHFFLAASHHNHISCIFTLQSQFMPGQYTKSIVRQCHFRFIMNDRADRLSLRYLSKQISPEYPTSFLGKCFSWLQIHEPDRYNRYLLLDMDNHSRLGETHHVRSRIFPKPDGELEPIVFSPAV